eukprot:CAMPEP_0114239934 /NCGR_PEP_ID=MMETSP0058-20121206/8746_1 /TAXON_ID=36894 /ORGANISM="Pyramimonas parkeae, CCMP726" /LENGTH=486 /DNA_ID=CAMNT_0001352191 /DNA_START=445 /DNA_END=1905 /DNA_ORIENTATION=+
MASSVGVAVTRVGPGGAVVAALLATGGLLDKCLELAALLRALHADLEESGMFAKLQQKRLEQLSAIQREYERAIEEVDLDERAGGKKRRKSQRRRTSLPSRGHAPEEAYSDISSADLDVAEDEPLRTCASTCAGTGKASKGWRWMRWGLGVSTASKAGRAIWQSLAKVPVGAARLNGERRERRRMRAASSTHLSPGDEAAHPLHHSDSLADRRASTHAHSTADVAPPENEPLTPGSTTSDQAHTVAGTPLLARVQVPEQQESSMGTPGAWLNRLSQFTIETPSSRKPRKADRPAEQKKVVSKKGGLQQVHEIVSITNNAILELHEVVKIDRVQRFLPDLSKRREEALHVQDSCAALRKPNALQQVTLLTENVRQAVTDLRSTAVHLESLDDRMHRRMQDLKDPAWRRNVRWVFLYVLLYTTVAFVLIYIVRSTIKFGLPPLLESLFHRLAISYVRTWSEDDLELSGVHVGNCLDDTRTADNLLELH